MQIKYTPTRPQEWHQVPTRDPEDAGWDFYAARTVTIHSHQFAQIPTNISLALPKNHWGLLLGRSSTFLKRNLMVHQGTLDSSYRGEVMGLAYNPTDKKVIIKAGDRVFQLIIMSLDNPQAMNLARVLPVTQRGSKGFGSTGQ